MKTTKEFIKVYNQIFWYIYLTYGNAAYEDFLRAIAPTILDDLEKEARENGLAGCMEYWKKTLYEEGICYDLKTGTNSIEFTLKPCKSLAGIKNPFPLYCNHCRIIYPFILKKYGLSFSISPDYTQSAESRECQFKITSQKPSLSGPADTQIQSGPPLSEQT